MLRAGEMGVKGMGFLAFRTHGRAGDGDKYRQVLTPVPGVSPEVWTGLLEGGAGGRGSAGVRDGTLLRKLSSKAPRRG